MAGLTRKASIQFGNAGPTSAFGQFGSKEAGTPQTSQDPDVIQALAARWQQGWQTAVVSGDKAAYIEDMNGYCLVQSYQITYLFQMGVPEWDATTLYFTNSVVQTQTIGQWFRSLQGGAPGVGAGQSGNAPPVSASNAFWLWLNPPQDLVGTATLNKLPKVTTASAPNGIPGSAVLGDSAVSDNGTNVIIALPLKFPDNSVQSSAASPISSRLNCISPSVIRAIGVSYLNATGKPMQVAIGFGFGTGQTCSVYTDSTPSPSTPAALAGFAGYGGSSSNYSTITVWVLPGDHYQVIGSGSLVSWNEWT